MESSLPPIEEAKIEELSPDVIANSDSKPAASGKLIVKATIIANTRYSKYYGHQHLTDE